MADDHTYEGPDDWENYEDDAPEDTPEPDIPLPEEEADDDVEPEIDISGAPEYDGPPDDSWNPDLADDVPGWTQAEPATPIRSEGSEEWLLWIEYQEQQKMEQALQSTESEYDYEDTEHDPSKSVFTDFNMVDTAHMPVADVLQREDGKCLFYSDKLNWMAGLPAYGKSWIALDIARSVVNQGGSVVWIDYEDTEFTMLLRAGILAMLQTIKGDNFQRVSGYDFDDDPKAAMAEIMRYFEEHTDGPQHVVIDSAWSSGLPHEATDLEPWMEKFVYPLLRAHIGVTVIDHIPKRQKERPMGAIGSIQKMGHVTGVMMQIGKESEKPWSSESEGRVTATVVKDRPGGVGPRGATVATIVGRPNMDGSSLRLEYMPYEEDEDKPTGDIHSDIVDLLAEYPDGLTAEKIREHLQVRRTLITDTLKTLLDRGTVVMEKIGRAKVYMLPEEQKDSDDLIGF